jgi:dTDP-4-amino-4,6-dideoxygalactose transaminase
VDGLDASIARKRAVAAVYDAALPSSVRRPIDPGHRPHGYNMYVGRHPRGPDFGAFLRRHGIDCGIGAEVLPACAGPEVAPGTHRVLSTAVELPMHDAMTVDDAERVCEVAVRFETGG